MKTLTVGGIAWEDMEEEEDGLRMESQCLGSAWRPLNRPGRCG